ncbi:SNF2 family N-terminal domain-containing protein [Aspergillus ambiguus]|uniref:SNF2 family N-terminal domain-containing protein n=1 Tax=Aspergillus ambiguus TaxID=176160 RepID=UPI003CCE365E
MASNAAMLLDPKAYRRQQLKKNNGNDCEPSTSPSDVDDRDASPDFLSAALGGFPAAPSGRCPSPPEDPIFLHPHADGSLFDAAAGSPDAKRSPRGPQSPAAPPGTASPARRLLSPRQPPPSSSGKASPSVESPSRNGSVASSPYPGQPPELGVAVEFASTRSEDDSDSKRHSDFLEDDVDLRHGSLIEDMYGVERRGRQPYKKLKTDSPVDEKGKSGRVAIAGDSGLGKWMKDADANTAPSFPVTPDVVDLTLESAAGNDDDDLQVTGSNNLSIQRVCYGKIENAFVQAFVVPKPVAIFDSTHDWPSMKLNINRRRGTEDKKIEVADPNGMTFGAVDARTAAVVVQLLDSPALQVDIAGRLDARKRGPNEYPWMPCSAQYRASFNLYGLRKDAELVGKFLGQHNLWLGTPFSVEQGTPIFNPHAELRRAQQALLPGMAARGRSSSVNYDVRTAEEVNDAVMKMFDQLQSAENIPEMDTPPQLVTPLLRHQKQALWFMTEKERPRKFGPNEADNNSLWRLEVRPNGTKRYREIISGMVTDEEPPQSLGGLLADMMGLGKTLSILSLVVSSLGQSREWADLAPEPDLVQAAPGIRNTKTTLLVVPLSAVNNWVSQIKEHLAPDAVSSYVFHGSSRTTDVDELSRYDLVITTYSIVLSELAGRGSKRGVSPLTKMNMFRIVLDEAHTIREQSAAQTQAIFKLRGQRKWSVTGTPIQNHLKDLFSVTRFIGLCPYDDRGQFGMHILSRFKTGDASVLASLRVLVDSFTLRRVKDKIDLPARHDQIITLNFTDAERQLHEFFRQESNVMMRVIAGEDKTKMKGRMYHHILKAMMILRQVSAHGKELLDADDRARIKGLSVQDAIDLEEGGRDPSADVSDKKAYEMFTLMQESSADACATCGKRLEEPPAPAGGDTGIGPDRTAAMAVVLPCFDVLCPECFAGWKPAFDAAGRDGAVAAATASGTLRCPACDGWIPGSYSTVTVGGLQEYMVEQAAAKHSRRAAKVLGEYEGPHTKTKALVEQLQATAAASAEQQAAGERPLKSVVFSAWTSHLDLIEIALKDQDLSGYTRLDGTMTLAARNKALTEFHENDTITVLLATIGAGGVGLNLTAASKVYIMEPQYNPAAVAQAIDRVHRIGQRREVTTVQFLMKGSIEEKIFELAKKKQQLADLSMNRGKLDKKEVQEQRMREYRSLFK